jgi:glyoxylase-like metal-dependent hydrolase (beta-lactamase superfamily II)
LTGGVVTSVRRVLPLILGWERLPRSFSLYGETSGERLVEPVPALLLDTDDGWALIDTGFNDALIRDPWLCARLHGRNRDIEPLLPPGDGEPLAAALAVHGVDVADVTRVYLSHLHNDHAGGLRLFEARVPVVVQQRELAWGFSEHPGPEQYGTFRVDYDDPRIPWQVIDGDAELAPGITAVLTPGHTPGHMSFVVDLPDGSGYVFAVDAGDLIENFEDEIAPGGFVHCAAEDCLPAIRRLKALAAERGYPIIPGHDPRVWPALLRETTGLTPPQAPPAG